MKKYFLFKLLVVLLLFFNAFQSQAQFTLTGQVRTRTEYRDGQGTLPVPGVRPSVFTSQRTRLGVGYNADRFRLYTAIQDVRVWGMDASTISNMEGNKLFLHEGWGEIIFNDTTFLKKIKNLSLKIGRQEIVYDDARLLGNLDWLQQGRRHDAAILKFAKGTWQADAGFAYNQNREKKNAGTIYVGVPYPNQLAADSQVVSTGAGTNGIGTMYKSMQYLYVAKEIGFTRITGLFFKDDFQKPLVPAKTFSRGTEVNSRITTGFSVFSSIKRKHKAEAYAYYQGNKDNTGKTLDAYSFGASLLAGIGRKFMVGPGIDFLSGNDLTKPTTVNNRFDPLYGTPHKFWGYMDYFYVADPYGTGGTNVSPGLLNYFLKAKYRLRDNLMLNLDVHEFYAGNDVLNPLTTTDLTDKFSDRRLGTELDFVVQYGLGKNIAIEGGYSIMLGTDQLDVLKGAAAQRNNGNWAYLMVSIRTDFLAGLTDKLKDLTGQITELNKKVNEQK